MKIKQSPAPHIRNHESSTTMMFDMLLLLAVLMGLATFYYGSRALVLCAVSVATAAIADGVGVLLRGKRINFRDLSPVVTGMIIALCMPASIPYRVVITASLFAILVVKQPFGGTGHNPFNPAAAGFSMAALCWPDLIFRYPEPYITKPPVFGAFTEALVTNPAATLSSHGAPVNSVSDLLKNLTDILLGNFPGPMGATNIIVILIGLAYLLFRHTVRWQSPVAFLLSCALLTYLFPRSGTSGMISLTFELCSGFLLFGAVFMITDPGTSPSRESSLFVYGFFVGLCTIVFRYFGKFEESLSFAILFANAFVPVIDRYNEALHRLIRRNRLASEQSKKAQDA